MTESAIDLIERAVAARKGRQLAESVELYAAALSHPDHGLTPQRRLGVYSHALKTATRIADWPGAESLAVRGIEEFPDAPYLHQCLGEALMQQDRVAEAEAALQQALDLNPEQDGARALLAALRKMHTAPVERRQPRGWPTRLKPFDHPASLIHRYLLRNRPKADFVGPDTVFMTMGSCFAENLAERLRAAGHAVHFEQIGEEVNSTFANRYLLEWVEKGAVDAATQAMDDAFGAASRERLRRAFASTQVFVMTLGVAPSFFDREGRFVFIPPNTRTTSEILDAQVMRTTTVAENVENIGRIIDAVRRLAGPEVRIVLTISPVPLAGTTEFDSAITADCLSKSTLRVACQEVLEAHAGDGVIYWPSFEIVRWLGAHFGPEVPRVYGGDDGNSRHVSTWLVNLIVRLFLEHHSEAAA